MKLGNPARSEAAAFRWLIVVVAAAASVIALTLLTRPLVGALWGLALLIVAAALGWRAFSHWRAAGPEG